MIYSTTGHNSGTGQTFIFKESKNWNGLSETIVSASMVDTFKTTLKFYVVLPNMTHPQTPPQLA